MLSRVIPLRAHEKHVYMPPWICFFAVFSSPKNRCHRHGQNANTEVVILILQGKALGANSHISRISFVNVHGNDDLCIAIAAAIGSNPTITHINLEGNDFSDKGLSSLAIEVGKSKTVGQVCLVL